MPIVDLARLTRDGRVRVHEEIAADASLWHGLAIAFAEPVQLDVEAQPVGEDVLVRGTASGVLAYACRRCLKPVRRDLDLQLSLYYEADIDETEAQDEDVYAIPERGDLELGPALREQMALTVSPYATCREDCRGLCPQCGADRNETACDCTVSGTDERWAALQQVEFD